jgi:hypothetical protein
VFAGRKHQSRNAAILTILEERMREEGLWPPEGS